MTYRFHMPRLAALLLVLSVPFSPAVFAAQNLGSGDPIAACKARCSANDSHCKALCDCIGRTDCAEGTPGGSTHGLTAKPALKGTTSVGTKSTVGAMKAGGDKAQ